MSSYAHEKDQCIDFLSRDKEMSKCQVDYDGKQEKVLLTRRWVEQQRVQPGGSLDINELKDRQNGLNHSFRSVSSTGDNRNGDIHSEDSENHSIHENKLLHNPDINREILLIERRLKDSEGTAPFTKNHLMTGMPGSVLSNKLADGNLHREGLRLPLLPKSPLISPCGSPCASPRSSICAGSDSSVASSPTDSPLHSPKARVVRSLPRRFIHFKEQQNDELTNATRSLPGSPKLRRSLYGRASDLSESLIRRHTSFDKEASSLDKNQLYRQTEDINGNFPLAHGIEQRSMSHGSRPHYRRPGTPVARDLKPGLRMSQYSKSMSDLGSIAEKSAQVKDERNKCILFPSIATGQ